MISDITVVTAGIPVATETVETVIQNADGPIAYAVVFVLAAIPWFEILLVIPPGIALGLHPVWVVVFAFIGNTLTVLLVVLFQNRVMEWLRQHRGLSSTSSDRARQLRDQYGLPVLALASPVVTGSHIGAMLAIVFGSSRREVAVWMTGSLFAWAVGIGVVTAGGLSIVGIDP